MTWGEFKRVVEEKGAKDDDVIWYIDVSYPVKEHLVVRKDEEMDQLVVTEGAL